MERRNLLNLVLTISIFTFFTHLIFAAPKNTKIDVIVDTSNIDSTNIKLNVWISDNRQHNTPVSPDIANSEIDLGKWVQWKSGVKKTPDNRGDKVSITRIVKKNDPTGTSVLKGGNSHNGSNGVVKADVEDRYIQDDWEYIIYITVTHDGEETRYMVDPKLRMIPPR